MEAPNGHQRGNKQRVKPAALYRTGIKIYCDQKEGAHISEVPSHDEGQELVVAQPSRERQQVTINIPLLRELFLKCTQEYEGNSNTALINVNIKISAVELQEVEQLTGYARAYLKHLAQREPLFPKFKALLEKHRAETGRLGEVEGVTEWTWGTDVEEYEREPNVMGIRVPPNLRRLYLVEQQIKSLEQASRLYRGVAADGTDATSFGRDLKEVYEFVRYANQALT